MLAIADQKLGRDSFQSIYRQPNLYHCFANILISGVISEVEDELLAKLMMGLEIEPDTTLIKVILDTIEHLL